MFESAESLTLQAQPKAQFASHSLPHLLFINFAGMEAFLQKGYDRRQALSNGFQCSFIEAVRMVQMDRFDFSYIIQHKTSNTGDIEPCAGFTEYHFDRIRMHENNIVFDT